MTPDQEKRIREEVRSAMLFVAGTVVTFVGFADGQTWWNWVLGVVGLLGMVVGIVTRPPMPKCPGPTTRDLAPEPDTDGHP